MKSEINYQIIGRNIKEARKSNQKTQRVVSEFLDILESTYSNLECGREKISLSRVIELSEYFGIRPGDILNDCTEELRALSKQMKFDASYDDHQELHELIQKCSSLTKKQMHFLVMIASRMVQEKIQENHSVD